MLKGYHIMFLGEHINLKIRNKVISCGFVKNEYIISSSMHNALKRGRKRIIKKLKRKHIYENETINIRIEYIANDYSIYKVVARMLCDEGFIFFH